MELVASVNPSVCPCLVCALLFEPFDLRPRFLAWGSTLTLARMGLQLKVVGQRSRSNAKNRVLTSQLPCFKLKVKGQGQGQRSRSRSEVELKGQSKISGAQRSILRARLAECNKRQLPSGLEPRMTITSRGNLFVCL